MMKKRMILLLYFEWHQKIICFYFHNFVVTNFNRMADIFVSSDTWKDTRLANVRTAIRKKNSTKFFWKIIHSWNTRQPENLSSRRVFHCCQFNFTMQKKSQMLTFKKHTYLLKILIFCNDNFVLQNFLIVRILNSKISPGRVVRPKNNTNKNFFSKILIFSMKDIHKIRMLDSFIVAVNSTLLQKECQMLTFGS